MSGERPRFRGLFAAAHTPFNRGGRLYSARIAEQHALLVESGVEGVFVCGTAGEGHSLTSAERRAVLDTWVGVTDGTMPIIAHVGHSSIREAERLARHAAGAGATAIAAMSPAYYRPETLEDLVEFLAPIAAAAPELPFLYYDAPDFNGVCLPTDQVLQWGRLRIPNLAGVKFTSSDLLTFQRCLDLGDDFDVLLGYEELLLPALAAGCRGAIGVSFNFAAPVYHRVMEAFHRGDLARARDEQRKAADLGALLREHGVVRASKAIMSLLGVECGDVRTPLRAMERREFQDLFDRVRVMDLFARPLGTPAELGY